MLTMNSSDIRQNFSEVLEKAKLEPIEITKRGKPLGAIISYDDLKELMALKEAKIQAEFDRLMQRHGHQIEALADK